MAPWFHGNTSAKESEIKLLNKPIGTFLVRFSTTTPGAVTISKGKDLKEKGKSTGKDRKKKKK